VERRFSFAMSSNGLTERMCIASFSDEMDVNDALLYKHFMVGWSYIQMIKIPLH
jgi:hypothetical protein